MFDKNKLLYVRKKYKKTLLLQPNLIDKKIAILSGSTQEIVISFLEIFLLEAGIRPTFYLGSYSRYYEDAIDIKSEFYNFKPDITYIHTSYRNLQHLPQPLDTVEIVDKKLNETFDYFSTVWESISQNLDTVIIQNNFELPPYRLYGNYDRTHFTGKSNFISLLNNKVAEYIGCNENIYINDINYLSSYIGLTNWYDFSAWYNYKNAMSIDGMIITAYNVSSIIKNIYGKVIKAVMLDLDNTLWGGVIGDSSIDGIDLGKESAVGEAYHDFQTYLKEVKDTGILLNVVSKNDEDIAKVGFTHPASVLELDDFISFKANWKNKDENIVQISNELSLGVDSFLFIDDNPVEREFVETSLISIKVPEISTIENYIAEIDRYNYFEKVTFSDDDRKRSEYYKQNSKRDVESQKFTNYNDYLKTLEMTATLLPFDEISLSRVTQLINKTNQFNLTTRRYTDVEVKNIASSDRYITLYVVLKDKFGDNGIVSVVIASIVDSVAIIDLWVMSCRVFKRDLELLIMDKLVAKCLQLKVDKIKGIYYPTLKNSIVKNIYKEFGFTKIDENLFELSTIEYKKKSLVIMETI